MIVTKMRLVGARTVDLPIEGADASGPFVLKGADGLGPSEVDVAIAESAGESGMYQKRKAALKQPVIRIGLHPDWDYGQTPQELRRALYGLLTPRYGRLPRLELMNGDTVVAQAEGHISRFEISLFVKDPEVSLTLDTLSPYFLAPAAKVQVPQRSVVDGKTRLVVNNEGDAPSGFAFSVILQAPVASEIILSDDAVDGQHISIKGLSWAAGDRFVVNTIEGERGVWKIPSGSTVAKSVLNEMTRDSEWMGLYEGNNTLIFSPTQFDWPDNGFSHRPAYWGV